MTPDPRIASALDDVRRANIAVNRALLLDRSRSAIAADLSYARVELSVAAGKLAQIVEESEVERGAPFDEDLSRGGSS